MLSYDVVDKEVYYKLKYYRIKSLMLNYLIPFLESNLNGDEYEMLVRKIRNYKEYKDYSGNFPGDSFDGCLMFWWNEVNDGKSVMEKKKFEKIINNLNKNIIGLEYDFCNDFEINETDIDFEVFKKNILKLASFWIDNNEFEYFVNQLFNSNNNLINIKDRSDNIIHTEIIFQSKSTIKKKKKKKKKKYKTKRGYKRINRKNKNIKIQNRLLWEKLYNSNSKYKKKAEECKKLKELSIEMIIEKKFVNSYSNNDKLSKSYNNLVHLRTKGVIPCNTSCCSTDA